MSALVCSPFSAPKSGSNPCCYWEQSLALWDLLYVNVNKLEQNHVGECDNSLLTWTVTDECSNLYPGLILFIIVPLAHSAYMAQSYTVLSLWLASEKHLTAVA